MDVKIIGMLIITIVVIIVSIGILYSLEYEAEGTFPERMQEVFKSFYQTIFNKGPYNICEAYDGEKVSFQEFQTLLLAVDNGQCENISASVILSFSLTKDDVTEIAQNMEIARKGELIFYRPEAKPMGADALIIEGNPGTYPLKLWDEVEIWQEGNPEPDILMKVTEQGCDPYDDDCDLMCSYKKDICDPYCYKDGHGEDVLCDIDCVDVNKNGRIDEGDFDDVCDLDCYNDFVNPERAYDPDCVKVKDDYGLTGCDPDSNGVKDGICDPDCGQVNYICDPDCDEIVDEGNPDGLKDDDCYTCDKTCNGFCAPVCTEDDGDPDCPEGYGEELTECCGNGVCGIGEDCETCQEDCPPSGDTCETIFDGVCCPQGANEDYGCISGEENLNLTEGEFCYCDNQCNETLICTASYCCPVGKFWDGTQCSDKFDVLIVALKSNLEQAYPGQLTTLEDKINEYILSLNNDGLGGIFLFLDEDETSDIIGNKVEKSDVNKWDIIDGILDQLIPKLESKYLIIVGGYNRFIQAPIGSSRGIINTDDVYGDLDNDYVPDIPVGRIIDPNNGDMNLLLTSFDTFISLHNSGGVDFSDYISLIMPRSWNSGVCYNLHVFGKECDSNPRCEYLGSGSLSRASGHKFFMLLMHGADYTPQPFGCNSGWECTCGWNCFDSRDVSSLDVTDSVWMIMPCYGGYLKNKGKTEDSIPMMFFRGGGAAYIGSTDSNLGSHDAGCPFLGGDCVIGSLYTEISQRFKVGERIGNAYKEGKIAYANNYKACAGSYHSYQLHINSLYGDPTININRMWSN